MSMQRTLVIIKPDAVERGLIGEIIARFEKKGFRIRGLKMIRLNRELAEKLYDIHRGKPFFEELIKFIMSGPIVAMILEGSSAIEVVRNMIGPTDGRKAPPGTIRGDYSLDIKMNIIHAADSLERAKYEISLLFKEDEIL
ncbi:MAG: nucleoside-diphosphate kinase [Thermoprotei archaeon]|nr:MAG: nucleoside-diphosphate kinase [Thermoprotei archaeon]